MATDKNKAEESVTADFFDVEFDEDGNIVVWDDTTRDVLEKILGSDMEYIKEDQGPQKLGDGPVLCG